MKEILVSSEEILPIIEKELHKNLKEAMKKWGPGKTIKINELAWTEDGIIIKFTQS